MSLKSFRRKEESLLGEISRQNKVGKEVTETMTALSASAKEYRRPCPKPTSEVTPNPWDTECLAQTLQPGAIETVRKCDDRWYLAPYSISKVRHRNIRSFPKGNRVVQVHL